MTPGGERRRWRRLCPVAAGATSQIRLRTGRVLIVRDLSRGGARVEGDTQLLPGTHAEVHVIGTSGRQLVRSRIVWAKVLTVHPLNYEAALCFDTEVVLLAEGYWIPGVPADHAGDAGSGYPLARGTSGQPQEAQGNTAHEGVGSAFEVPPFDGLGRAARWR